VTLPIVGTVLLWELVEHFLAEVVDSARHAGVCGTAPVIDEFLKAYHAKYPSDL
jgi:hypothetical protein